ncbi:hypothetical protein R1sor_004630 [Riccia sorocarpa]|uniref:Ndc10 domain-containing protein n=1 Tax=Riccia sorocarpa TaxID=122646 RepID=A0ABD3HNP7_9MARC
MAELGGASESQIRRLGRWNNQAMENCYLTSLPREALRTLAGFSPIQDRLKHVMISEEDPTELQLLRALPVLA